MMIIDRHPKQELWFGKDGDIVLVPLVDLGNDRFVIKTKDDHLNLAKTLGEWLTYHSWLSEKEYKQYVEGRLGITYSLLNESVDFDHLHSISSIKNDIFQNNEASEMDFKDQQIFDQDRKEFMIKINKNLLEPSKFLYLGSKDGCLLKWDIEGERLTNDFGKMFDSQGIFSMVRTADSQYLYMGQGIPYSNGGGELKQFDIKEGRVYTDFGQIHSKSIDSIVVTNDNEYVFTGSQDYTMKQLSILQEEVIKDYGKIHNNGICSIAKTNDDKYQFTSSFDGDLKQWSIREQLELKNYEKVIDGRIFSMIVTSDNQFQFVSGANGGLKQIDIQAQQEIHDYKKIHNDTIRSIAATSDNQYLFTSSNGGHLKQWSISQRKLHKDYGQIHQYAIFSMVITNDNHYLFTTDGILKQWDIKAEKLYKDHFEIHSGVINSMVVSA